MPKKNRDPLEPLNPLDPTWPQGEWAYPEYPELDGTASANGTTGMMPTLPRTNVEYGAYQELAGMEIPRVDSEGIPMEGRQRRENRNDRENRENRENRDSRKGHNYEDGSDMPPDPPASTHR